MGRGLCHTGDLGSRFDFLEDIESEKNSPYPLIASLPLNSYHLFNSCWEMARGTALSVIETVKVVRLNG